MPHLLLSKDTTLAPPLYLLTGVMFHNLIKMALYEVIQLPTQHYNLLAQQGLSLSLLQQLKQP